MKPKYLVVASVGGVWVQYINQEFEDKEVALDLAAAIRVYMPDKSPVFRCFVIRAEDLQDVAGKSAAIGAPVSTIAYGSHNTFII